jgi:hypothetical protein
MTGIKCVYYNSLVELTNGHIAVGGFECVYIIDVSNQEIIKHVYNKVLKNISVNSILEIQGYLICGCDEGKIIFIQIEKYEYVTLKDIVHKNNVNGLICLERNSSDNNINELNSIMILSSSIEGTIKAWEI